MSIRDPNGPWNRMWTLRKPDEYTPGPHRVHQVDAFHLLRSGCPLTEWKADVLQRIAYQSSDLSSLQTHWLRRIERDALGALAA
jgi:hypothetical protein